MNLIKRFLKVVAKYKNIKEINREMLCELIDKIYVHELTGSRKKKEYKIEINYRFNFPSP